MNGAWNHNGGAHRIAVIGNHLPRRCGIATFTSDLCDSLTSELGGPPVLLALTDPGQRYDYPERVSFEIGEGDIASYQRAADYLNVSGVQVVSLQHEYGIFGGQAGVFVLDLLRQLRMPVVSTLHTVLGEPGPAQRAVMDEITRLSERVVVMSSNGAELLQQVHGVNARKIDVIPHGIPAMPPAQGSKDKLGLAGSDVLLTFGLLSPDKGIEFVIDALPAIVDRFPNVLYVVLGVTHPHVKERDGEDYRFMLERRAKRAGVDAHVVFHDRFVSQEELVGFLSAADVYITPYLNAEQITSGTLAYAVGLGKAVVSTPYRHARELLDGGAGALVPCRDSAAIARAVIDLLGDVPKRTEMGRLAAARGERTKWPIVARAYVETFEQARLAQDTRLRAKFKARTLAAPTADLPDVDLTHLRLMTDDTGILQHAVFAVPRYAEGYCVDDNARALLLTTMLEETRTESVRSVRALASRYMAFVHHAFDPERGRFRSFMDYSRRWVPEEDSEDCHGRALWALGSVVGRSSDAGMRKLAGNLFHAALPACRAFTSPRAWAYTVLGIDAYLHAFEGESGVQAVLTELTEKLLALFRASSTTDWPWFEDRLTYCNARLPQALIVAGARMRREEATTCGFRALEWLCTIQTVDGTFAPIGSNGFYVRGSTRAAFDQQPVEASATVSACLDAHRITGRDAWRDRAGRAFRWFLGHNQLQLPLYDATSGGCRDGLHADRVNENQGAESTLSFLLALLEMCSAAASPDKALS